MTGIDFARKLRAEERTKQIPLIMLTARSDEQDKIVGLDTGADDYITKPFSRVNCKRASRPCCAAVRRK